MTGVIIGFARIIGGAPSTVSGLTNHLLNETQTPEAGVLAQYYTRGTELGEETLRLNEFARQIAGGTMLSSAAEDVLIEDYLRRGADLDLLDLYRERIGQRLSVIAQRITDGLEYAPLAVLRPDIHPSVVVGLGIDPDVPLTKPKINALLAGRRADGEPIEAKHYAVVRQKPVDPRTGARELTQPIGSYDFCPTPDKSVSVAHAFRLAGGKGPDFQRSHRRGPDGGRLYCRPCRAGPDR